MSFAHRLLLAPFWFLPASILTLILFLNVHTLAWQDSWIRDGTLETLIIIAAALLSSILIYRWLMRPLRLERRALCLWAFMGVPLLAVAFITFLAAMVLIYFGLSGSPLL